MICPIDAVRTVTPSGRGCEAGLESGDTRVHLCLCRICGRVVYRDSSPDRHATAHLHRTRLPMIKGYDPSEGWGWCCLDDQGVEMPGMTPQLDPIPRHS